MLFSFAPYPIQMRVQTETEKWCLMNPNAAVPYHYVRHCQTVSCGSLLWMLHSTLFRSHPPIANNCEVPKFDRNSTDKGVVCTCGKKTQAIRAKHRIIEVATIMSLELHPNELLHQA